MNNSLSTTELRQRIRDLERRIATRQADLETYEAYVQYQRELALRAVTPDTPKAQAGSFSSGLRSGVT